MHSTQERKSADIAPRRKAFAVGWKGEEKDWGKFPERLKGQSRNTLSVIGSVIAGNAKEETASSKRLRLPG